MILPIILSGGSGTRLWPLSRKLYPKQFINLINETTLFQDTILQVNEVNRLHFLDKKLQFDYLLNNIRPTPKTIIVPPKNTCLEGSSPSKKIAVNNPVTGSNNKTGIILLTGYLFKT